tara:strand:+ start:7486 stop:8568 length:1083 start_codon:yes stop_codon:yes gene_type:complete
MFGISLSVIITIGLIFAFIAREALPVILEQLDQPTTQSVIAPEDLNTTDPIVLRDYLDLTRSEFEALDQQTLTLLLEAMQEQRAATLEDTTESVPSTKWRYLLFPYQWSGYSRPEFIWQPASPLPKYNIVPLLIGSLKTTLVALLFAVPVALGAAIYVSQIASPLVREWLKPMIELLAGIPSVVLGFFALIVMASFFQSLFGYPSRLNALIAGIALGFAVIPIVFAIAEDALTSVPSTITNAALALGSSRWQAAWSIALPAALPGIFAAVVLGFGRAVGETMIVLMATGNASIVSGSLLDSTRTLTATIAAELAETVFGSEHYRVLFLLGTLLFTITFVANTIGDVVIQRLKERLEGQRS